MLHSGLLKCIVIVFLLFSSLASIAEDKPALPPEIVSAKSMALIVRLIGGEPPHETTASAKYKEKIESQAAAEIQRQKHFELAPDPSKADLVCILITFWPPIFREGKSIWNRNAAERYSHPPQAIMVFEGGNSARWSSFPLWVLTNARERGVRQAVRDRHTRSSHPIDGSSVVALLKYFDSIVKKTRSGPSTASTNDSGENPAPEQDDPSADEQGSPDSTGTNAAQIPESAMTFCQSDFKNCHVPRLIYSAKSLLICGPQINCNNEKLQKTVTRWKLVEKPEQADLVMILSDDRAADTQLPTMYLFQGGSHPDWQAMPLFTTVGGGGLFTKLGADQTESLLESFQKFIVSTESSITQNDK